MVKKDTKKTIVIVVILALLALMVFNFNNGRAERPVFDGLTDNFIVKLTDRAPRAEVGTLYWMNLNVKNPIDVSGTMYVQCSILDKNQNSWISGLQSTVRPIDENCVDDEPFTQTAQVTLNGLGSTDVTFAVKVPNTVNGDNVIWCEAFERCYVDNPDTKRSSYVVEPITIYPADNDESNNPVIPGNESTKGDLCEFDSECKTLWFIGDQMCIEGYCVDPKDVPKEKEVDIIGFDLSSWVDNNKISIVFAGIIILIIWSAAVFKKPKEPKYY